MAAQDSRIAGLLREWNRAEFGLEVLYFETTGGTQFVVEVLNGNDALIERAFVGRFSADDPTRAEVVCLAARLQAWVRGTSRSKQWSLQERSTYGWVLIGGVGAWSIYHVVRGTPQSSLRGQSILAVGATLVGMYLLR